MEAKDLFLVGAVGAVGYALYREFSAQPTADVTEGPDTSATASPDTTNTDQSYMPAPYPPATPGYGSYNHIIAGGGGNIMSTSPMGMRYNNPGNLRPNGTEAHYPTMQAGILAALNNLLAYYRLHNLHTIRGIITRWAPPNENDTAAYINYVSSNTGMGPDQYISPTDAETAYRILMAIFADENAGQTPAASLVHSVVAGKMGAFA